MRKKILVVDNNEAFIELMEMVFSKEFQVLKAHDAEQGMKLVREKKPDIILIDVKMPRISGLQMVRQLQEDAQTERIPVVVLTASQFEPSTEQMFREEPNVRSFLKKPFQVEALRRQVQSALQDPEQSDLA